MVAAVGVYASSKASLHACLLPLMLLLLPLPWTLLQLFPATAQGRSQPAGRGLCGQPAVGSGHRRVDGGGSAGGWMSGW